MSKEEIIRKLTSRKFWIAIVTFVTGVLLYTGHSEDEAGKIGELIFAGAGVIAYIIGEGLTDVARATSTKPELIEVIDADPEESDETPE